MSIKPNRVVYIDVVNDHFDSFQNPDGFTFEYQKVQSQEKKEIRATAKTMEEAEKIIEQQQLPEGWVKGKEVKAMPWSYICVESENELEARKIAEQEAGNLSTVANVDLLQAGFKGIFGIGKRLNKYRFETRGPAEISNFCYRPAKYEILLYQISELEQKIIDISLDNDDRKTIIQLLEKVENYIPASLVVKALLEYGIVAQPEHFPHKGDLILYLLCCDKWSAEKYLKELLIKDPNMFTNEYLEQIIRKYQDIIGTQAYYETGGNDEIIGLIQKEFHIDYQDIRILAKEELDKRKYKQ